MKGIPINKGNYSMDTIEREQRFEMLRGQGWEADYNEYRKNWSLCPKEQKVLEYPLLIDIELSTVCNLKCPMCYTITEEFKNSVGHKLMDFEMYKKIVDEIGGKVSAIRLSLRGEATLHKRFIECITYAKLKGVKEISFLTNGSLLTKDFFTNVMKAGVDWITISVDGLGDKYENIRAPIRFNEIFETIKMINCVKKESNKDKPLIKIQAIWPAIREEAERFYNTFVDYVDLIAFNPLIDYLDNDDESKLSYEEDFLCPQLYQRLIITSDGKFLMCSNDENQMEIVGDIRQDSIYSVWHGDKITRFRDLQKEKDGFKSIQICRRCYLPRKTNESETTTINGRHIIIKNYENRIQEIGV